MRRLEKEGSNKFNRVISTSNKDLEDRDQRELALSKGDVQSSEEEGNG